MTFDEMGFVQVNRYFVRHIPIDEAKMRNCEFITQLEQFNPNDFEDVGSWSPYYYLCQIKRDQTDSFVYVAMRKFSFITMGKCWCPKIDGSQDFK